MTITGNGNVAITGKTQKQLMVMLNCNYRTGKGNIAIAVNVQLQLLGTSLAITGSAQ